MYGRRSSRVYLQWCGGGGGARALWVRGRRHESERGERARGGGEEVNGAASKTAGSSVQVCRGGFGGVYGSGGRCTAGCAHQPTLIPSPSPRPPSRYLLFILWPPHALTCHVKSVNQATTRRRLAGSV